VKQATTIWQPRLLMGDPEELPVVFPTITADPPWAERGGGVIKRGADRHYGLLDRVDILRAMVTAESWRPAEDAHLYLWVTNTFLPDGLWLMDALDFRYKTNVVWTKRRDMWSQSKKGLGFYFRGEHELCLFGTRGSGPAVRTQHRAIGTHLPADHGRDERGKIVHSRKPREFGELVEARSKGPYLEMFARSGRPGWASWGNELHTEVESEEVDS